MRLLYDAFSTLPSSVATDLQDRYQELWNELQGPYFRCTHKYYTDFDMRPEHEIEDVFPECDVWGDLWKYWTDYT